MTSEDLAGLFLHEKPSGIMLSLKDSDGKYASILSKENDCTYTHTLKILGLLESNGLVEFKKEGRIKFVSLTSLGEDVAHELGGLVRHLGKNNKSETTEQDEEESEENEDE